MTQHEELVDVIDERERVIKTIEKRVAHEEGLLHACVVSEVIDSSGRWLLTRQAADRQDAGQWVSPFGGHVTAGETYEQALLREAAEEVGLKGELVYEYVGTTIFNRTVIGRRENHLLKMYKIFSDTQPTLNNESVECAYFTENEISKKLSEDPQFFGDAFHFVVRNFFPHLLVASGER